MWSRSSLIRAGVRFGGILESRRFRVPPREMADMMLFRMTNWRVGSRQSTLIFEDDGMSKCK